MKRIVAICVTLTLSCIGASAQRLMDNLDRGLVAVPLADNGSSDGTLISWRRLGTEYYDVKYNLYYNNTLLAENLTNTNYLHKHVITGNETYEVAAVMCNVIQPKCAPVTVWTGWQKYGQYVGGYKNITLGEIYSRNGTNVTDSYWANDIEVADLDGDGELEFIIKRMNMNDANAFYVDMTDKAYDVFEAYKFDGTRLWWIDVGANMVSLNSTETNIIAFDWDQDGAAEVVLRGADDMVIHYMENGKEQTQNIGTYGLSYRNDVTHSANATFTNTGNEYLVYLNGASGKPYPIGNDPNKPWIDYPLPRLEQGETSEQTAWGTGILGHRSSKYYMGAPYLDGRKPSLFLGRGIYTRHKMMAMDLNPNTHKWNTRWSWACNNSNSPWYGQGYHNYLIADVDEDGRDEIVYGSMVIDDNGKGLYTTGYGHGDAQHVSDFDPWTKGLEFFGCLEDYPYWGCNYRNAANGDIYYKYTSPKTTYNSETDRKYVRDENGNLITDRDDGRALMANFSNTYPGSLGRSAGSDVMSTSTRALVDDLSGFLPAGNLNFRIYWDGDLLSEWQDSPGQTNDKISINKPGLGRIFNADGTAANNDTKHNTCFQGDIIGDWREEFIARVDSRTIRIYTSGIYSNFSLPSLWYDHQYRQAMATQEMVYNLPPHLSFFLGELEGYTVAPPPQMTNERTEIENNGTITSALNGKQVIACKTGNMTIHVDDGVSPWVFTDNAPSWVQGSDLNGNTGTRSNDYTGALGIVKSSMSGINYSSYTHTVDGGAFTGAMHLAKQGDGTLILPNVTESYTGDTKVWAGTLQFDGTMQSSPVWMNRHTTLNTTGGQFLGGLTMEYGAILNVGGTNTSSYSSVTASNLTLNYGAHVVLDVNGNGDNQHDWLNANTLIVDDSKVGIDAWEKYGPEYIAPVIQLRMQNALSVGAYLIGNVNTVDGDLSTIVLECDRMDADYLSLIHEDGKLYLQVSNEKTASKATIEITGMAKYAGVSTPYPSTSPDDYYLPVVSIVAKNTNGQAPTLSGTFTTLDGTVTTLQGKAAATLYKENFEGSSTASDYWRNGNGGIYTPNYTNSDGHCIGIVSSGDKGDFIIFNADYVDVKLYNIDFDAFFNNASKTTDFAVMSKSHATSWVYNWGYNWLTTSSEEHNPFLFFMRRGEYSTTFTINQSSNTVNLDNSIWYHFTLTVDIVNGTVDYTITKKGNTQIVGRGSYTLPANESAECDGFYIRNGRYNYEPGGAGIDNIVISTPASNFDSFTFPEPGTLRVESSVDGYASGVKTFEVKYPYYKYYGKDFDQITSANISEMLGSNWKTTASSTRWAFWNKTNSIYGENYQAYWVINNTSPIYLCNDNEPQIVWMDSNNDNNAAVLESFGVGRNSSNAGATIHVQNCGDSQTLIYYLVDNSRGNAPSRYGGMDKADTNGNYTIAMEGNYTLAKLYIYIPVSIHDERAAALPTEVANGNAHLYRSALKEASSWSTMVVPFDLTAEQAKDLFGEDVVIGNLIESSAMSVRFETTSGVVHANQPFLIKNVTKDAPYLVMGITSTPVVTPKISTDYFDFIGRYTYPSEGVVSFNPGDYFFNAETGLLSTVGDNTAITMKGYHAYFHTPNSQEGAKDVSILLNDEPFNGITTNINTTDHLGLSDRQQLIYNLQGQRVTSNWNSPQLQRGVYIMNGKKVIIK